MSVAEGGNDKGFGYKYMCKFFSVDIYDYLQEYDFYFRLGMCCASYDVNDMISCCRCDILLTTTLTFSPFFSPTSKSHSIPSHPIPSNSIPSHPIPPHHIPSHPIPSHRIADSDCYITRLDYDIFQWAEDNDIGYAYAARKLEGHKPTRDTLPQFTQDYMDTCQLSPAAALTVTEPISLCYNFYNNFHLGSVAFFRQANVQHYLRAVLESGNIGKLRWGDSTIQAYAVRLFMDPQRVLYVPDFAYVHESHGNMQIDTANNGKSTRLPQKLEPLPRNAKSAPEKKALFMGAGQGK